MECPVLSTTTPSGRSCTLGRDCPIGHLDDLDAVDMYLQFGVALLDGCVCETLDHFAELRSLLVEELLSFSLGSERLFDFALASTSNLLELVDELPFLFAAVSGVDEGVTHFRSQVGPAGWTNNVFRYHNNISSMSPWTRVNLLTGLGQYLLGFLSDPGHLGFRSLIYLASFSRPSPRVSRHSTLSLLPSFPTCSSRSLTAPISPGGFLWCHQHRRVVNELSAFALVGLLAVVSWQVLTRGVQGGRVLASASSRFLLFQYVLSLVMFLVVPVLVLSKRIAKVD